MNRVSFLCLFLIFEFYSFARAQNVKVIQPDDNYLVEITQQWGSERSVLGDLRTSKLGDNDIELRFWAGYGLWETGV